MIQVKTRLILPLTPILEGFSEHCGKEQTQTCGYTGNQAAND